MNNWSPKLLEMGEMDLDIDVKAINRPVLFRLAASFGLGLVEPVVDSADNLDIALFSCTPKLVSVKGRDFDDREPAETEIKQHQPNNIHVESPHITSERVSHNNNGIRTWSRMVVTLCTTGKRAGIP